MTRTVIQSFVVAIAAGAVMSVKAYIAEPGDLTVDIPFAFEAGEKAMPAGEYIVRFEANQTVVRICEDGVYCTDVEGVAFDLAGTGHASRVVFEDSEGHLRLSRVEAPNGNGVEVRNSELAKLGGGLVAPWTIVAVPAREICIHPQEGSTFPAAWH